MKIAFIGYGNVGAPLADQLQRLGHEVTLAAADPSSRSVQTALARNRQLRTAAPSEAVRFAEAIFLATPFGAAEEAVASVAAELTGKILIDCTNPVGSGLSHGLNNKQSGSEFVQRLAPEAQVVKAFTVYGFENLENNSFPSYNVKPAMFFCGNDPHAKQTVSHLIAQLGWEPLDVGGLDQALHLEHMTLLWVRMVRLGHASPHIVWAALKRGNQPVAL